MLDGETINREREACSSRDGRAEAPSLERKGHRRALRRQSGQSLIEMVLVLPLLLLVLFGLLEFANAWRTYQVITNSAREGARHATVGISDNASVQLVLDQRMQAGGLDPAKATFRLALCNVGGGGAICQGLPDTVEISYPFQFRMIGPIAELICGACGTGFGSVTLFTRTVMRNEE